MKHPTTIKAPKAAEQREVAVRDLGRAAAALSMDALRVARLAAEMAGDRRKERAA
jgi:hypothetical protein